MKTRPIILTAVRNFRYGLLATFALFSGALAISTGLVGNGMFHAGLFGLAAFLLAHHTAGSQQFVGFSIGIVMALLTTSGLMIALDPRDIPLSALLEDMLMPAIMFTSLGTMPAILVLWLWSKENKASRVAGSIGAGLLGLTSGPLLALFIGCYVFGECV